MRGATTVIVSAILAYLLSIATVALGASLVEQTTEARIWLVAGGGAFVTGLFAAGLPALIIGRQVTPAQRGGIAVRAAIGAGGYLVLAALVPLLGGTVTLGLVSLATGLAGAVAGAAFGLFGTDR